MFVTAWSSWPAESIEIDQRPEGKSRRRFTGTQIALGAFRPGPYSKQCSPRLPAQLQLASGKCKRLRCFSAGEVTIGHIICGFELFIYFSSWLCCPLWFQGSPQTQQ